MAKVLAYSAKKNIDQRMPLYSMNGPPMTSDSATGMSKGVRPTSARPARRKRVKATGWRMMNQTGPCSETMAVRSVVPATMTTLITAMMRGSS